MKIFEKAFYAARTPAAAAANFAYLRPGGPQVVQWLDEAEGVFRLVGKPHEYRVETFSRGYAVFRIG